MSTDLAVTRPVPSYITVHLEGRDVSIAAVSAALALLDETQAAMALSQFIRERGTGGFKTALDIIELSLTEPFVTDMAQVAILTKTMTEYTFNDHLDERGIGIPLQKPCRADISEYWRVVMRIARLSGFTYGQISPTDMDSLIPASNRLVKFLDEMVLTNMCAHLPSALLNNEGVVEDFLGRMEHPFAYIAVLVGQTFEDLKKIPGFFEAFNLQGVSDPIVGALRTIGMCLANKG